MMMARLLMHCRGTTTCRQQKKDEQKTHEEGRADEAKMKH
jgi:hypothetical protein